METIGITNWDEFLVGVKKSEEQRKRIVDSAHTHVSERLFRGQSDSVWPPETTLEREGEAFKELPLTKYHRRILLAKFPIEAFTGNHWSEEAVPSYHAFENTIGETTDRLPLPATEFMAYLRHHGFPSPFLDWTRSAYIAAYFAFATASKNVPGVLSSCTGRTPALEAKWHRPRMQLSAALVRISGPIVAIFFNNANTLIVGSFRIRTMPGFMHLTRTFLIEAINHRI